MRETISRYLARLSGFLRPASPRQDDDSPTNCEVYLPTHRAVAPPPAQPRSPRTKSFPVPTEPFFVPALANPNGLNNAVTAGYINRRILAVLHRGNITTLEDLLSHTPEELLAYKGFGPGSLRTVDLYLKKMGLAFTSNPPPTRRRLMRTLPRYLLEDLYIAGYADPSRIPHTPLSELMSGGPHTYPLSDTTVDHLARAKLLPPPQGPDELLNVMSRSPELRERLKRPPDPSHQKQAGYLDRIIELETIVTVKIASQEIDHQALLKLRSLESFNQTLMPGCRNLPDLLVAARTLAEYALEPDFLKKLSDILAASTLEDDLLKLTGPGVLNAREHLILLSRHRPRNRLTYKELAERFGLSTSRVSVIERQALSSIRIALRGSLLPYLRSAIFRCADLLPHLSDPPRRTGQGRSPLSNDPLPAISERLGQNGSYQTAHRLLTFWLAFTADSPGQDIATELTGPPLSGPTPPLCARIHQRDQP